MFAMPRFLIVGLLLCSLLLWAEAVVLSQNTVLRRPGSERPAAPEPPQLSRELERVLRQWEQKSSNIRRLEGAHKRWVYNNVFLVEKRSIGKFYYQAPDKGRLDIEADKSDEGTINPKNNMKVESDTPEKWISTGREVLRISEESGTYHRFEIPPERRGQNIIDSPLPFLFGMKAEQAKIRYQLQLGGLHGRIYEGRPVVHILAKPNWKQDQQQWKQAQVLLDAETYLPMAIKLIDVSGSTETVYAFKDVKANEPFREGLFNRVWDPFQVNLAKLKQVELPNPGAPPPPQVPSVVGLQAGSARQILERAGYKIEWKRGPAAPQKNFVYRVLDQQPPPKAQLPKGETVIVTVYIKMDSGQTNRR